MFLRLAVLMDVAICRSRVVVVSGHPTTVINQVRVRTVAPAQRLEQLVRQRAVNPRTTIAERTLAAARKKNGSSKKIKLDESLLAKEGQVVIKGSEKFDAEGDEVESSGSSSDADIMAKAVRQTGKHARLPSEARGASGERWITWRKWHRA